MSLISNLSAQLKQYRKKQDITLMEFSSMLGISKSSLQNYEPGRGNPTLNTIEQIGQKMNMDSGSLLFPGCPRASQSGLPPEQLQEVYALSTRLFQICSQYCGQQEADDI